MPSLITIWDILKLQKVLQLPLWSMFNNNMGYIETSLALYSQHRQLCLITIWDILKPTRASLVDDGNLFNNNMGYIETLAPVPVLERLFRLITIWDILKLVIAPSDFL